MKAGKKNAKLLEGETSQLALTRLTYKRDSQLLNITFFFCESGSLIPILRVHPYIK